MRIILDTHAFLWWIADDPRLSRKARALIGSLENEVFVSAASMWEIAVKTALGRLQLPSDPGTFLLEQIDLNGFSPLAVSVEHTLRVLDLPSKHRDPFDRLLAAQCLAEKTVLVTRDPVFRQYDVTVQW